MPRVRPLTSDMADSTRPGLSQRRSFRFGALPKAYELDRVPRDGNPRAKNKDNENGFCLGSRGRGHGVYEGEAAERMEHEWRSTMRHHLNPALPLGGDHD